MPHLKSSKVGIFVVGFVLSFGFILAVTLSDLFSPPKGGGGPQLASATSETVTQAKRGELNAKVDPNS